MVAWQIAKERHLPRVVDFLCEQEWGCVSFTSQLHRDGSPELPSRFRKRIHFDDGDGSRIAGAVLQTSSGLLYPVLAPERSEAQQLPHTLYKRIRRGSLMFNTVMGRGSHVHAMEQLVPKAPSHRINYYVMVQDSPAEPASAERLDSLGIQLHCATPAETDQLYPLQEGYEREEVLLDGRSFQPQAAWHALKQALRHQIVVYATSGGRAVAKAATNARGFYFDQIGGVFTEPAYRNKGIAQMLMRYILGFVQSAGKRASLFVKTHNASALSLYRNLGFRIADDFRITYYL